MPVNASDDSQRDRRSTADAIVGGSPSRFMQKLPARQPNQWSRDPPSSGSSLKLKSRCRCIVAASPGLDNECGGRGSCRRGRAVAPSMLPGLLRRSWGEAEAPRPRPLPQICAAGDATCFRGLVAEVVHLLGRRQCVACLFLMRPNSRAFPSAR